MLILTDTRPVEQISLCRSGKSKKVYNKKRNHYVKTISMMEQYYQDILNLKTIIILESYLFFVFQSSKYSHK